MSPPSTCIEQLVSRKMLEEGRFLIEGEGLRESVFRRLGLCSVRGRTHAGNDDYVHIHYGLKFREEVFHLFAVYDGVTIGIKNQKGGGKASVKAATAVNEFFRDFAALCRDPEDLVHSALDYANNALDQQTNATTAVLAFLNEASGICYMGSVGDSRACILRAGQVHQISIPHRLPNTKNVLTRKLGPDRAGRITEERGDISINILLDGDVILLHSDGVEDVSDEVTLKLLKQSRSLQEFAEGMVALGAPKGDDCTVIAVAATPHAR